ncbi:hypothetical protein, partial [Streptomyces cyaneofuscatus]|uniref:hypothetical protein n=1 Tax=Streptomyces cyaneofuscatus TaxID=66883 RepID=UPI00365AD996
GFVHERRVSGARGLWTTLQLFANVPLSDDDALVVWREAGVGAEASPSVQFPAVGDPGGRVVGGQLPVDEELGENSSRPPTGAPLEGEVEGEALAAELVVLSPQEVEAERVLLSLRNSDRQLRLGVREARELVGLVVEWLRRGVSAGELRRVLSSGLPPKGVRSAVGFLRHRLEMKMPEAPAGEKPPAVAEAGVEVGAEEAPGSDLPAPPPAPPYVPPLVTCQGPGNEHVFRAYSEETECPDCQQAAAYARWAERRAADLGIDLAEDAAKAVEAGRDPDGWRSRLAAAAAAAAAGGGGGAEQ